MAPRRRPVRSIIVRVVVFLLLGAVVNVAVAWGFAALGAAAPSTQVESSFRLYDTYIWEIGLYADVGAQRVMSLHSRSTTYSREEQAAARSGPEPTGIAPRWSKVDFDADFVHSSIDMEHRWEDARGWPLLSLRSEGTITETSFVYTSELHAGFELTGAARRTGIYFPRVLPLCPIWPGFAINTVFYAASVWLLFAFPFALRRWRRIRRGLCAKCAYPFGASDVCTECGASIVRRSMGLAPVSNGDSGRPATPAGSGCETTS